MRDALIKLKDTIKEDLIFFFPSYDGVQGFFGDSDVFSYVRSHQQENFLQ
jgi:hypothetical protein